MGETLTDDQKAILLGRGDRRFDAYYYGFDPTGNEAIDLILMAVAYAGKLAHHTEDWTDRNHYLANYGHTPAEIIQRAANSAAGLSS